ncbi:MAG: mucin-like protein [Gemmataceae bacterium]|nr:mucin-like protein [Gemmataceae bacterium]
MSASWEATRTRGWRFLPVVGLLAVLAGPSPGQQPPTGSGSGTSTKGLDGYGWTPSPAKIPDVKLPDVKTPDYFGPSTNQSFDEKTLFPTPPPALDPPKTPAPDGLPPPPSPHETVAIPDGSLPRPPRKVWKGGVEFGLNGSQGNSDVLSLRFGANADRKVDRNLFHLDFLYTFAEQDHATKQNQAILNARDEILFPGSPWSLFSALQVEYDAFRAYDLRVGSYAGFSYRWVKTETTLFKTRLGAGAVREFDTAGTAPDRWVPEAVIGGDFNHRFTDRQGFVSSLDVFPNLSQLGQYRVRARGGYEIVIDPSHGMVLRLGVQDRYDTNPGPARRNDLNYFVTLMFKF